MTHKRILEISCFNLGSALIAQSSGADRIEFCSNYWEGGITPIERHITELRERIKIPVHVIIRCRGGDYYYSDSEMSQMCEAVTFCKKNKVDGIVIGVLTDNNEVDVEACKKLKDLAGNMNLTFHRAIDHCTSYDGAIEDLIGLGIDRVLTSGGEASVTQGLKRLTETQKKFGKEIIIMPGGGLRSSNIHEILHSGCNEYHSAALTDNTVTVNAAEIKKLKRHL
jgi:copper homeostasis protein